jgi:hypothetical protein
MPQIPISGTTALSAARVQAGIDASADIDAILEAIKSRKSPQLREAIVGTPNAVASTPAIVSPGEGRSLVVVVAGWYNATPTNGLLSIVGSDAVTYLNVPVTSSGAGFLPPLALPPDMGCTINLSAGGAGVTGYLNYATAIEVV